MTVGRRDPSRTPAGPSRKSSTAATGARWRIPQPVSDEQRGSALAAERGAKGRMSAGDRNRVPDACRSDRPLHGRSRDSLRDRARLRTEAQDAMRVRPPTRRDRHLRFAAAIPFCPRRIELLGGVVRDEPCLPSSSIEATTRHRCRNPACTPTSAPGRRRGMPPSCELPQALAGAMAACPGMTAAALAARPRGHRSSVL